MSSSEGEVLPIIRDTDSNKSSDALRERSQTRNPLAQTDILKKDKFGVILASVLREEDSLREPLAGLRHFFAQKTASKLYKSIVLRRFGFFLDISRFEGFLGL